MPYGPQVTRLTFAATGVLSTVASGEPVKVTSMLFNGFATFGDTTYTVKTADGNTTLMTLRILGQVQANPSGRFELTIPFNADAGIGVEVTAFTNGAITDRDVMVVHHSPGS